MSIELYAGKGTIHNVGLNTEALNEVLDKVNLPYEITQGFIGYTFFSFVWLTLRPVQRSVDHSIVSLFSKYFSSILTNNSVQMKLIFFSRVSIDVPWSALISDSTAVEVDGLEITVQPKSYCTQDSTSMMDSRTHEVIMDPP